MIDVDVNALYLRSHGEWGRPRGGLRDTTDHGAVGDVCRKVLELLQAYENLRCAIRSCGDCVRLRVGGAGPLSMAAVMAAAIDATSGERVVFLDSDDQEATEDALVRALHRAYDTSSYVRRAARRLRRPAA